MFSELVDRAVSIAGRPDELANIVFYANEIMRGISKHEEMEADSVEELVVLPHDHIARQQHKPPHLAYEKFPSRHAPRHNEFLDEQQKYIVQRGSGLIWSPQVGRHRFKRIGFCYYDNDVELEPTMVRPSRRIKDLCRYYYGSGDDFVFVGVKHCVKIYYYAYQPWLQYYPQTQRPCVFLGEQEGWKDEDRKHLVSNWMLERHNSTVLAGTLARFFAVKSDPRQQVQYSLFSKGLEDIVRAESTAQLRGRRHG